jgi:magnesium chelatase accessory protein
MLSLPGMARAVGALLRALDLAPELVVGHSAGAAVALQMALSHAVEPKAIVGLNSALMPMRGFTGRLFSPIAKLMACGTLMPRIFARNARDRRQAEKLLHGTGSALDERGIDLYARLFRSPRHASAALGMMARWDLDALLRDLPRLETDLVLVVGENDRTVPPSDSSRAGTLVSGTRLVTLPRLGHLAHEEDPEAVARIIVDTARAHELGHAA